MKDKYKGTLIMLKKLQYTFSCLNSQGETVQSTHTFSRFVYFPLLMLGYCTCTLMPVCIEPLTTLHLSSLFTSVVTSSFSYCNFTYKIKRLQHWNCSHSITVQLMLWLVLLFVDFISYQFNNFVCSSSSTCSIK